MSYIEFKLPRRRTTVRRTEDLLLRKQFDRYTQLFQIGQFITSEINFDTLFDVIPEKTNQIMDTERCSVFLVDEKAAELTAFVSTDLKRNEIKLPCNQGVAGWVYCNQLPLNVPDVYADTRFYHGIDQLTGFKTKNILCVPLVNRNKKCIGTVQALNKKSGDFTDDDRELISYLANFITVAIENAKLYEEIKAADEAKQRAIHHLSHELKTPLSIISAAFSIIEQKTRHLDNKCLARATQRGRRSVARLMDLQEKVDDIINKRRVDEDISILSFIEDTLTILEELDDGNRQQYGKVLRLAKNRIESLFAPAEQQIERLPLDLLRIKVFSEIFGFSMNFESSRCKFIPLDTDLCEGKISACPFIKERADCLSSGGSTFSIVFKN